MDDFLSKFDKKSYDETKSADKKTSSAKNPSQDDTMSATRKEQENGQKQEPQKTRAEVQEQKRRQPEAVIVPERNSGFDATGEVFEKDPDYQRKQKKKYITIGLVSCLALALGGFGYYKLSYVDLPDFSNKAVSEARAWGSEKNVKIDVTQDHNLKVDVNNVISQNPQKNKKIKKNSTLKLVVSLGADPEELIALPKFSDMTKSDIEKWQESVRGDNVTIMEEYDEKVPAGKFLKEEFKNSELQREKYTRGDQLIIYVSKGKEVYKKDIPMPDFKDKVKADVEKWAKTNKMAVTYNKVFSDKVAQGLVADQSIKADEKIAKETKMTVDISEGKGVKVPNFADLDMTAAGSVEGLNVQVKEIYTLDMPYGSLVSQSVPAEETVAEADSPVIKVVYSIGEPYLKSYYGLSEGDLEKTFYEDYQSKGARIYYEKYYMDSDQERGTVVKMSNYNAYVGLDYTVQIGISNGSKAPDPTSATPKDDEKDMANVDGDSKAENNDKKTNENEMNEVN